MHCTHVRYSIHSGSPEGRQRVIADAKAVGAVVGEQTEWTDGTGKRWWGVTFNPQQPLGWELNP